MRKPVPPATAAAVKQEARRDIAVIVWFVKALGVASLVFEVAAGAPSRALAEDRVVVEPSPSPPGHLQIVVEPPVLRPPVQVQAAQPQESGRVPMTEAETNRHAELSWSTFRSRNVLIGSAAATAVGAALVFPAEFTQCPGEEKSLNRCTPGGKAMVLFGYPLLLFGGLLTLGSGIAFGVMKGELRRFEQRAARRESRALRWDPARARFVF